MGWQANLAVSFRFPSFGSRRGPIVRYRVVAQNPYRLSGQTFVLRLMGLHIHAFPSLCRSNHTPYGSDGQKPIILLHKKLSLT